MLVEPPHRRPRGRRWKLVLAGVFALALLVFGVALWHASSEPVFQDRRLSFYFADLTQPASSAKFITATNALLSAGKDALPVVLRQIQSRGTWYGNLYFNQRSNMPVALDKFAREKLDPSALRGRYHGAIRAVGILGTNAEPIAAALLRELPETAAAQKGILAEGIAKIGPAVVDPVKTLLDHPDMRTRNLAAFICYQLGVSAADAAPEVAAGLRDADANHAQLVGQTLGRMGAKAMPVILDLIASTSTIEIRAGLTGAATTFQPAPRLVGAISEQLDNSEIEIRAQAALWLSRRRPLRLETAIEKLASQTSTDPRVADYARCLDLMKAHETRWKNALASGLASTTNPRQQIQVAGELVRHEIITDALVARLESMTGPNYQIQIQRGAAQLLERAQALLNPINRTN